MHSGRVYIGADSASINLSNLDSRPRIDRKVFSKDGYVIGFAGSFRAGQILKFNVNYPDNSKLKMNLKMQFENEFKNENENRFENEFGLLPRYLEIEIERFFVTEFIEAVKSAFKEYEFVNDNEDSCSFLVGFGPVLVEVETDFQVGMYQHHAATGLGSAYALGSLHGSTHLGPEQRIKLALGAAAEYNAGVLPPFYIERT